MNWNLYDGLLASADSDQSIRVEKNTGEMPTNAPLAAMSRTFASDQTHHIAGTLEKCVEALALYLATRRLGAIYLLFNAPRVLR
jgi:malonyl-CoA/methylmalonyl-CoA synthetase